MKRIFVLKFIIHSRITLTTFCCCSIKFISHFYWLIVLVYVMVVWSVISHFHNKTHQIIKYYNNI